MSLGMQDGPDQGYIVMAVRLLVIGGSAPFSVFAPMILMLKILMLIYRARQAVYETFNNSNTFVTFKRL